jgi:hypothetical protein
LLYSVDRYVLGLTSGTIPASTPSPIPLGTEAPIEFVRNPLYAPAPDGTVRDPNWVFLAGIVGVPWQDLARDPTAGRPTFLTAAELASQGRWPIMLGDPSQGVLPQDPFMLEQSDPRPEGARNPLSGDLIVGPESTDPYANRINGHEYRNLTFDDLQYACTFEQPTPKDCGATPEGCNCDSVDDDPAGLAPAEYNRPTCNPPEGGEAQSIEYFGRAYPSARELEVLRKLGDRAVVGSTCPHNTFARPTAAEYGYNPVMRALVERMSEVVR